MYSKASKAGNDSDIEDAAVVYFPRLMAFHGVPTTHHLLVCWSWVAPTPAWPPGWRKPFQVCMF